jgi:hypothetical protein
MCVLAFIKDYPFLVDLLIAIVGALYGGIYLHSTKKRRSEAKYGFYINYLQFIRQLEIFVKGDNNDVIELMSEPDIRRRSFILKDEIIAGVRVLSKEFLFFLNTSKDIIPPAKKEIWYENLLEIVAFLQWGTMAGDFYLIVNKSRASEEINSKRKNISKVLKTTKSILNEALGLDEESEQQNANTVSVNFDHSRKSSRPVVRR